MRAIQILKSGGPEVLTLREIPTPVPGPGEALMRLRHPGSTLSICTIERAGIRLIFRTCPGRRRRGR